MHNHINKPCGQSHKPPLKCNYLIRLMREKEFLHGFILIVASHVDKGRKTQSSFLHLFIGSRGASTLIGGHCHAPPWFSLMEPHHVHTHLMMDHDLTQSRHCHTGQCRTDSLRPGHLQHLQTSLDRRGWCADGTCTTFSHLFFNILFDSINHSHVHMYISCWGPEEQSPSLEINFNSTHLVHLYPARSARGGIHLMKEVETGEPMQSLSSLPLPHLGAHMCY